MIKYVLLFFYFYKILTAFNKLKIISEVVLLLPNTDRLQQDYVRGCTWQLKKVKTTYIYRFHELVFDWGDNSLGCFNRWTQNYELWTDRLKTMSCEPIDSKLWVVNQSTQNYELWTDRLKSMGCEPIDSKIWAVNRSTQNYEKYTPIVTTGIINIAKYTKTSLFINRSFNTFRSIQCEQFKEKLSEIRGWGQADRHFAVHYRLFLD